MSRRRRAVRGNFGQSLIHTDTELRLFLVNIGDSSSATVQNKTSNVSKFTFCGTWLFTLRTYSDNGNEVAMYSEINVAG